MGRALAVASALTLLGTGLLLTLYGLFAIVYRGDSGGSGDTYVTIAGREMDADLVGVVALALGVVAASVSILMLRARH